jgi:hypothetical protein
MAFSLNYLNRMAPISWLEPCLSQKDTMNTTNRPTDMRGTLLEEGDTIIFSAGLYRSQVLRIGTILEIIEKEEFSYNHQLRTKVPAPSTYTLKVEWTEGYAKPEKPTRIRDDSSKILRLS